MPCHSLTSKETFSGFLPRTATLKAMLQASTPLNRDAPRHSGDIDIFHNREERVPKRCNRMPLLQEHGYVLKWEGRDPSMYVVLHRGRPTQQSWNGS